MRNQTRNKTEKQRTEPHNNSCTSPAHLFEILSQYAFYRHGAQHPRKPVRYRFRRPRLFSGCFKTLLELVKTTAGIDELLLTRKKRMALGADINVHIACNALGLNLSAACALDGSFLIIRMDTLLHVLTPHILVFCVALRQQYKVL